jgi:hypothetical protein
VDAQIKLSVVASDIFGVSGRAMLAALVAGERDPKVLAQLARARMRAKLSLLEEAFTGFFTDQQAFLLAKMLARVDGLDADLAELDAKLAKLIAPLAAAVERLDEISRRSVGDNLAIAGGHLRRLPVGGYLRRMLPQTCRSRAVLAGLVILLVTALGYQIYREGFAGHARTVQPIRGHDDGVTSVAFSPDGKTLASASEDQTVLLRNPVTGQNTGRLTGHNARANSVAFSPDGKTLASASEDWTVQLWNPATGQLIGAV